MIVKVKSVKQFHNDLALLCVMCNIDHRQSIKSQTVGDWVMVDVNDDLIAQLRKVNPKATAALLYPR